MPHLVKIFACVQLRVEGIDRNLPGTKNSDGWVFEPGTLVV